MEEGTLRHLDDRIQSVTDRFLRQKIYMEIFSTLSLNLPNGTIKRLILPFGMISMYQNYRRTICVANEKIPPKNHKIE